jgi:hypothetical protein
MPMSTAITHILAVVPTSTMTETSVASQVRKCASPAQSEFVLLREDHISVLD